MTKWLQYVGLQKLIEYIYECFTHRKQIHEIANKKNFVNKHIWL